MKKAAMRTICGVAVVLAAAAVLPLVAGAGQAPSQSPNTPFKLATFEAGGQVRLGMVIGTTVLDLAGANAHMQEKAKLPTMKLPTEMRALIESYATVAPRLYQIANDLKDQKPGGSFAFDAGKVSFKAPIKYPYNLMAAAANYRNHANAMFSQPGGAGGRPGGAGAIDVDPDRDDPYFFAKSPRSCIVDPGTPYTIPAGRDKIDWEGELAIVMGKSAFNVSKANAHDYVFGYSILYDVSDRGGRTRAKPMFPGPDWFSGKSRDGGAPFGPVIVPKEFLPNHANLRIVTKVNDQVMQDGNTKDMIYDEAHQIAFLTSIMTLYPGDLISTGTPEGTGAERNSFLKPGDVVTIDIEGIGTLTTPIRAGTQTSSQ
jgi:2-keto-4-pentenoate hydratase/2-oxohepta-3-ene-1,7-dioic acid hydratase in catechol pathway